MRGDCNDERRPDAPHVAFGFDDRDRVDAFYVATLGAGGRDNGGPRLRPQYDANYYASSTR
jgi:hypothetical protein